MNDPINYADMGSNLSQWAKWFGKSDYVGIMVPKSSFENFNFDSFLDIIGPTYNIDIEYLNLVFRGMWYF